MPDLIRWEPNSHGTGWLGYAGTLEMWMYQVWDDGGAWQLQTTTGPFGKATPGDGPDELKARAEDLLREFASSIGAVFPDADRWRAMKDWLAAEPARQRAGLVNSDEPDAEDAAAVDAIEWALLTALRKMTELEGK